MPTPTPTPELSALHIWRHLQACGVTHVFANLGTDHVSLIEALADLDARQEPHPELILCPHENVAVHMAAGMAAVTGQGQAVMVHVDAGTANAVMGLHNACRSRWPLLLIAGKSPHDLRSERLGGRDNYVHFVQDPFDMGSLVRPYVKWEFNLPHGSLSAEVLRRAHSVMHSDPPGPVYLTLPREVLAEPTPSPSPDVFSTNSHGPVRHTGVDESTLARLAERLMSAHTPVAFTAYLGRDPGAVAALEDLALLCGMACVEFMPTQLCIDRQHPCFAGFAPGPWVAKADVGLLLDVDVPWLPNQVQPQPQTHWIHVDVDPLKSGFPQWGFASHDRVSAHTGTVLRQLADHIRRHASAEALARATERVKALEAQRVARQAQWDEAARAPGQAGALSAAHLMSVLGELIDAHDIVVNEAIRNVPAVLQHLPRRHPGTLVGCGGGGLGYSGGMALGIRLARPDRRVIQIVGDGGFHFSTPSSVYATAERYGLPILTVVLDNGGWQAVKEAVLRVHPDGQAHARDDYQARLQNPTRRFEAVGAAFGAHAERVQTPDELRPALQRALAAIDVGQAAVVTVALGLQ